MKIVTPAPTDKAQVAHRVELQPAGLGYGVAGNEDLLSAAAAAGIQAPAACRNPDNGAGPEYPEPTNLIGG